MKRGIDLDILLMNYMNNQFVRFFVIGVINTLGTYIIYLLMLLLFNHNTAYTIAYVLGILMAYVLNSKFTFKVEFSLKRMLQYPMVYLVQYLINIVMLNIFVLKYGVNDRIAPIIVIVISIPITFLLSKFILIRR